MAKNLKPVPEGNKGLPKLPTEVRNKMGFMKKGGPVNAHKQEAMSPCPKPRVRGYKYGCFRSTDFELDVSDLEEAMSRGLEVPPVMTLNRKKVLNLMLADWANRGLNQWTIEQTTVSLTEDTAEYTLGASTIDVLDAVTKWY